MRIYKKNINIDWLTLLLITLLRFFFKSFELIKEIKKNIIITEEILLETLKKNANKNKAKLLVEIFFKVFEKFNLKVLIKMNQYNIYFPRIFL